MSASEQTAASKRKVGYYWVKLHQKSNWEPAYWMIANSGSYWLLDNVTYDGDRYLFEIDERRIERPSTQHNDGWLKEALKLLKEASELQGTSSNFPARVKMFLSKQGQPDELSKAQERVKELEQSLQLMDYRVKELQAALWQVRGKVAIWSYSFVPGTVAIIDNALNKQP